MELLWRLFVAGVVVVGPTVLFLGLWHGLMRLRNGELVRRVCTRMDETPASVSVGASALKQPANDHARKRQAEGERTGGPVASSPSPSADRLVRCERCGRENVAHFDYCRECQVTIRGD